MAAAHGLQRNRAAATAQIPEGLRWIRADRIKDRRREAPLAALVAHGRLQNCSGAEAPGIAGGVLHDRLRVNGPHRAGRVDRQPSVARTRRTTSRCSRTDSCCAG